MRIGLNCLRTAPGYGGGVNSFTFGLLDGFAATRRTHQFVLFHTPENASIFSKYADAPNFRLVTINEKNRWTGRGAINFLPERVRNRLHRDKPNFFVVTNEEKNAWMARGAFKLLPWRVRYRLPLLALNRWWNSVYAKEMLAHADIFYVPYAPPALFPYPDAPTVYSIHDLQHAHYPQFFSSEQLLERRALFASCGEHAALIQASSEQMRDDFLANISGLTPDRIVVIREGVDVKRYAQPPANNDVRSRYGLPDSFMYYPAQLWHHKNHITVLKAVVRLRERGISRPLVLSGAKYPGSQHLFDFISQNNLGDRVFYLGLVPFEDVIALLHAAKFLITSVLYESSSIPILEAAAAGTPVIASHTPANEERTRDLQMQLFTPTDNAELAALLAKVWDDDATIRRQVEHNNVAIRRFAWSSVAEDYLDAFEKLHESSEKRRAG